MQNKKSQTGQNTRTKGKVSDHPTRLYKVVALKCITVDKNTNKPYFFLFSDIDDKDKYHLSRILKFFAFNKLSFYWYETSKGYHVLSPCLLDIEEWYQKRRALSKIENGYYEGLHLRISRKKDDPQSKQVFYESSYLDKKYKESYDLSMLMYKRSEGNIQISSLEQIQTRLDFVIYKEIELIES